MQLQETFLKASYNAKAGPINSIAASDKTKRATIITIYKMNTNGKTA